MYLLILLLLVSCGCSSSNSANDQTKDILKAAEMAFAGIPDHSKVSADTCKVRIRYHEMYDGEESQGLREKVLTMVSFGDKWLLDDFNNAKENCINYIRDEVRKYRSGETFRYMKSMQDADFYTDEYIAGVEKSFEEFISKNNNYITTGPASAQ